MAANNQCITHLAPGDAAPAFVLSDQYHQPFKLAEQAGKKVVLYFYPNDDSQTCIKEACNLRDHYVLLQKAGYVVVGISHAPVASKIKFAQKYKLPFTLLSDPGFVICKSYGVYGDKFFMGKWIQTIHRITFVIDEQGIIAHIIYPVKSGFAAQQILETTKK